ncbi:MAG: class I SAM-dependent methyltransferase [Rhodospirillales bacterium]
MTGRESEADRLYRDPELTQFYDLWDPWNTDMDFCSGLSRDAGSVLDLGCGTGVFLAGLDPTLVRTGVDPAEAMLEIARDRPGGETVDWIEGDARSVRLDRRFDLVVMTGHAFQVFLDDDDMRAVAETIAVHLAPGGRFVFDSRNPAREAWRTWVPDQSFEVLHHPRLGKVESWNDVRPESRPEVFVYETHYRAVETGETWSAESKIRFAPKPTIEAALGDAGLTVDQWLGDWHGGPYADDAKEIIPLGRLARPAAG